MPTLAEHLQNLPQVGRLEWIGLAPARKAPHQAVEEVAAHPGTGLDGDHHAVSGRGKRQVTLIQQEHLPVIGALAHVERVVPGMLRRNLVVSGINLLALRDRRFAIGDVVLRGTGPCDPCSRMEAALGPGGLNAMRGHGGITAAVLDGGTLRLGAAVRALAGE